jgi:8-oxo-dGTP pyrophosphatase MutT (NUDIX family)
MRFKHRFSFSVIRLCASRRWPVRRAYSRPWRSGHAQDKFLIVEETINGKALWNQPAGHLEANETLLQATTQATVT